MPMPPTVLLIEDSADTARLISGALHAASGHFEVPTASSGRAGMEYLAGHPVDCVLLDYRLPDLDGLECLRRLRRDHLEVPVVMITGAGSEELAVEAMKLGATDYVVKHGKYLVTVPVVVRGALGRRELERTAAHCRSELRRSRREVCRLRRELRERYRLDGIVGESAAIEHALFLAERAAQTRASVLLEGETGTGKELFARAIPTPGPGTCASWPTRSTVSSSAPSPASGSCRSCSPRGSSRTPQRRPTAPARSRRSSARWSSPPSSPASASMATIGARRREASA